MATEKSLAPAWAAPYPNFEEMTSDELRANIKDCEDKIQFGTKHGAEKLFINHFIIERKLAQAELARRNGSRPRTMQDDFWPELLSAKQLLEMAPDPTRWIWEKCLPVGSASVLVAKPKVGKSVFAANLSIAVARGVPFLDRVIQQGSVAYLSLDASLSEIKEVFEDFGLKSSDPIFIHAGQTPQKAIEWLTDQVSKYSIKLIVIDTLQRLLRFKNIKDYSEVSNTLEPILSATRERNCHAMFLHHAAKESIDDLDSAIGSVAIRGLAYSYLHLKRLPSSEQRIFLSDQRKGENFEETAISDPKEGWLRITGSREHAEIDIAKPLLLNYLKDEEEPITEKEIRKSIPRKGIIVSKALRRLMKKNEVERVGTGKRGDPFRYSLAGRIFESCPEELEEKNLFHDES